MRYLLYKLFRIKSPVYDKDGTLPFSEQIALLKFLNKYGAQARVGALVRGTRGDIRARLTNTFTAQIELDKQTEATNG